MRKNPKPYNKEIYSDLREISRDKELRLELEDEEISFVDYVELFDEGDVDSSIYYALKFEDWVFNYFSKSDFDFWGFMNIYDNRYSVVEPNKDYWIYLSNLFQKVELLMGEAFYEELFNENDNYNFPVKLNSKIMRGIVNNFEPYINSAMKKNQLIEIYTICLLYWSYHYYGSDENIKNLFKFCNICFNFLEKIIEEVDEPSAISNMTSNDTLRYVLYKEHYIDPISKTETLTKNIFLIFDNENRKTEEEALVHINYSLKDLRYRLIKNVESNLREIETISNLAKQFV